MTNPMTTQKTTAELIFWLEVQAEGFGANDCGNMCLVIKDRLAELEAALKSSEANCARLRGCIYNAWNEGFSTREEHDKKRLDLWEQSAAKQALQHKGEA